MRVNFLVAALLLFSATGFAHEYWLEPESFFLAPNQKTIVRLFVGDGLIKDREERPFQLEKTPMFKIDSRQGAADLLGGLKDGSLPIYEFGGGKAGNYLLGMERNWTYITLEPDLFAAYLREDGMEYIMAEREKLGESKKAGRERYSRYIKALLQVGDVRDETYKKKLGLKLELIPLENPYAKKVGDKISFQVLFDGKPLAGRTVFADNRESETQKMTTDSKGRFSFKLDNKGLWLARLVFMQRCKAECGEADWESYWGAFSFGVR
ncbi:MAG: DUF4198 domain-containing protein [Pyrinomonadaceae bacterium]